MTCPECKSTDYTDNWCGRCKLYLPPDEDVYRIAAELRAAGKRTDEDRARWALSEPVGFQEQAVFSQLRNGEPMVR